MSMSLGTPTGCANSLLSLPVGFQGSQASSARSLWPQRPSLNISGSMHHYWGSRLLGA